MKKLFAVGFSILTFFSLVLCLVGCGKDADGNGSTALKFGETYYSIDYEGEKTDANRRYFVFSEDGTGTYHYYSVEGIFVGEETYYHDYTVTFSYTFVDKEKEAVACTFESVKYAERDTKKAVNTNWNVILTVSEDVLMNNMGQCYYSNSYLDAHPAFGKKA